MANSTRRLGVLGTVTLVLLVGFGVLAFVRVTSGSQPPRRCAGGTALPPTTGGDPIEAIRSFAPQATPPPYIRAAVTEIPSDGWIRRSDTLYEHGADDNRLLQLDVTTADGRSTVTGLWLCTPIS